MTDDEPRAEALHFTRRDILTVDRWPARTALTEGFLRSAHQAGAVVEGDTVTFTVSNGSAVYELKRELPQEGDGIIADLVEAKIDGHRTVKARPKRKPKAR